MKVKSSLLFLPLSLIFLWNCNIPTLPTSPITYPTITNTSLVVPTMTILSILHTPSVTETKSTQPTQIHRITLTPRLVLPQEPVLSKTPDSDQSVLSTGEDSWRLLSFEILKEIDILGYAITPVWQNYPITHNFLFLKFECISGKSLIELFTGKDMGLTFIHNANGYQDVYILDTNGKRHPITMLGDCWMAAPVAPDTHGLTLQFMNMPPLELFETQPLSWGYSLQYHQPSDRRWCPRLVS
jgi:hypothetical protein